MARRGTSLKSSRSRASDRRRNHWEEVYRSREDGDLSWWQTGRSLSLKLIRDRAGPTDRILDAGGGASNLAELLWDAGFHRITVVDISARGLARARDRMRTAHPGIRWLRRDLGSRSKLAKCDLWHDRAVFHFLVRKGQRAAYLRNLRSALAPGGLAIVATFALGGPPTCSGLPVERYSPRRLARTFGGEFVLEASASEVHRTPWGAKQPFAYAMLRRRPSPTGPGARRSPSRRARSRA